MSEPDWEGALDAMVREGRPAVKYNGWYYWFEWHGEMQATVSRTVESDKYTTEDFRARYKEVVGKKWRG